MDWAIDARTGKRITAKQAYLRHGSRSVSVNLRLYRCGGSCNDYVGLRTNRSTPYFYHRPNTGDHSDCENRVARYAGAVSAAEATEAQGLPLYLLEQGEQFALAIGFSSLHTGALHRQNAVTVLDDARRSLFTTPLSPERFFEDQTTLIPVSVYSSSYRLRYTWLDGDVITKWGDQVQGMPEVGSFFRRDSLRIVRQCGAITVGTEYYLVSQSPVNTPDCVRLVGKLELRHGLSVGSLLYDVYSVCFASLSEENEHFCARYGVILSGSVPSFHLIWPPAVRQDQSYRFNGPAESYWLLDNCKYEAVEFSPSAKVHMLPTGPIAAIPITESETELTIINPPGPSAVQLIASPARPLPFEPGFFVHDGTGRELAAGFHPQLPPQRRLSFVSNCVVEVYQFRVNGWLYARATSVVRDGQANATLEDIRFGDRLFFHHGIRQVFFLAFEKVKHEYHISQHTLVRQLTQFRGMPQSAPSYLRHLQDLYHQFPLVCDFIRRSLVDGVIDRRAIALLSEVAGRVVR